MMIRFFLLLSFLSCGFVSYAGPYLTGSLGALVSSPGNTMVRHGSFTVGAGYALPALLKIEMFLKNSNIQMVGLGGRLNIFPLFNLNGGVVQRLKHQQEEAKSGFFFGPGIHFELIPVVDLFADLNYYNIGGEGMANCEAGIRLHF